MNAFIDFPLSHLLVKERDGLDRYKSLYDYPALSPKRSKIDNLSGYKPK